MDGVMSQKLLKEAFVSNLNGTTLGEVALGSFVAPLCVLNRGLFLVLYFVCKGTLPLSWSCHFLLDFTSLILPMILLSTVFSPILHLIVPGIVVIDLCLLYKVWQKRKHPASFLDVWKQFIQSKVESNLVPFITIFRVEVNVKTALCILAVDFSVFPRRYAKTETYGTGVMDIGVGAYILANALVCPEARRKEKKGSHFSHVLRQLWSVWPLFFLGMVRFISVKMSGYQEHVTEYGVHWNFFFTLAIVRVVASVLLAIFPVSASLFIAILICGFYQVILETTGLKDFIIHSEDRTGSFLAANREGIFSVFGYVAIYMAGVQTGLYLMERRPMIKEWFKVIRNFIVVSLGIYVVLYPCQIYIEPVSRRMANLPYCIWVTAECLFFIASLSAVDIILLFAKYLTNAYVIPTSWHHQDDEMKKVNLRKDMEGLCLIQSVNRNQLVFFMFANLLTGLTNVIVDTVSSSDVFSLCVLIMYMFVNSALIFLLHRKGITLKFW
ncbi:phosphatidylinositol-glycan biosynthesis class W protein [Engraulis encrasicolus]|uniref:phosphatidylinositol-glycan biosynthesis class W protein n=1 Tax=Engraulis encrasicolus TaxID=184585 RepID=UPI002FD0F2E9